MVKQSGYFTLVKQYFNGVVISARHYKDTVFFLYLLPLPGT